MSYRQRILIQVSCPRGCSMAMRHISHKIIRLHNVDTKQLKTGTLQLASSLHHAMSLTRILRHHGPMPHCTSDDFS